MTNEKIKFKLLLSIIMIIIISLLYIIFNNSNYNSNDFYYINKSTLKIENKIKLFDKFF
jgi:uncharacterized membrane protein YqhA